MNPKPFFRLLPFLILSFAVAQNPAHIGPSPDDLFRKHHEKQVTAYIMDARYDDAAAGQNEFDALYYELRLTVQYRPNLLTGLVTGRFESRKDNLSRIILDMDDNLSINAISGMVAGYVHDGQSLEINLNRAFNEGEIFEVEISYSGIPDAGQGYNYFRFDTMNDGSPYVWTLSEPYGARYWWPCKDSPKDKPDSVDIVVTVPSGQKVASNGLLRAMTENSNGTTTFHWHESYPIATYLVSIAAGNYAWFQDQYISSDKDTMLLDYYVQPSNYENARVIFQEMHDYLDALSHYFGPYPFLREKYGMAEFGWGGAMENQTITSIGKVSSSWRYIYVHELGHHWFGDALTCHTWQEIWLNEGFASYSEPLYAEWAGFAGYPPGPEAYHAYMETQVYTNGGTIFREDTTSFGSLFNRIVYDKGSWVLHMLRHIVGDDTFFIILKSYANDVRWQYGSVKTMDFISVCEAVSGRKLDVFFDQWLNYPYYPEYAYTWEKTPSGEGQYLAEVTIQQRQNTIIYEMPVDLTFDLKDGGDTTITVENNRYEQTYVFELRSEPVRLTFDKDNWILKHAEPYSDARFTSDVVIEEFYPNPFNEEVTIIVRNWYPENISLQIFDVTGRLVRELDPVDPSVNHSHEFKWKGIDDRGAKVSSGVYIVSASLDKRSRSHARKLIKLK